MNHGKDCGCPVCVIGKKMGMIKKDDKPAEAEAHSDHENHDHENHDHDKPEGHKCDHC